MRINFVGNFQTTETGEISDETHTARSMQELGHIVRCIPRDEWREYVRENFPKGKYKGVPEGKDIISDITIFAKWHHFFDGNFINAMRHKNPGAPVFYWVWDSIDLNIDWHRKMAQAADLYLSGELGRVEDFRNAGIKFYYFQFDCVDGKIETFSQEKKIYDVTYLGTFDNQRGRMDILKEINKEIPIRVWGVNFEEWRKQGFNAMPAVFSTDANRVIAQSKIVLGTSCDPHLYGYWSNRVGRVLRAGGFLLQQYTPGMENFLHGFVEYYSTPQEAIKKIWHFLDGKHTNHNNFPYTGFFTSKQKVFDLCIMIQRYLKEDNGKDWLLP